MLWFVFIFITKSLRRIFHHGSFIQNRNQTKMHRKNQTSATSVLNFYQRNTHAHIIQRHLMLLKHDHPEIKHKLMRIDTLIVPVIWHTLHGFNSNRLMDWPAQANTKPVQFHRSQRTLAYSLNNTLTRI